MRIAFLLERPSQFDAPLFRFGAIDREHSLEGWFTAPDAGGPIADPELGRSVEWGVDLTSGYPSAILPERPRRRWLAERLAGVDLLIVNGYTRRIYLGAARAARRHGVPVALRIDSVRFPGASRPSAVKRLLVGRVLARRFDRFLTTGSLGEAYLAACRVPREQIARFPYAVDHGAFASRSREARANARERWGVPRDSRAILSLAKFSEREAPADLAAACRALAGRQDLFWIFAGDGPERGSLEASLVGLDRVLLPGYVPYPELPSLYAAADCFVHPAREERWGVSIAEALACGLPVVASDRVGAAFDLVGHGENGERYSAGDSSALAAALARTLALDPARVASTSARLLAPFGLEATWRSLLESAKELATRRPRSGS